MNWEEAKPILRPEGIHMGIMKVDKDLCTGCGLCIQNCPFSCWEIGEDDHPKFKDEYACLSCYNCKVACPVDAIIIVQSYYAEEPGFWATKPHRLPAVLPLKPKDKDGNPDQWNVIERAIVERRSVRNFKPDPVPDHLIRRVLEAGRFAPSAGNCQSWKFIAITDRKVLDEIDQAVQAVVGRINGMYRDDSQVQDLSSMVDLNQPGIFDPRVSIGGMGAIAKGEMGGKKSGTTLNAPAVILLVSDTRSISGSQINIGICGQNMNLVCNSLGIKACWVSFVAGLNMVPGFPEKLGIHPPWQIVSSLSIGWPDFKQEGIVPREFRPVTWFRPGAAGPVEETEEGFETV
jgi:nitroreductase/NAD-dependent dihydropyrimidine dehydrogenase PreA subunit